MGTPHYRLGGDELVGPDDQVWVEVTGWLEPDEVADWVRAGAVVAIDECESWEWGASVTPDVRSRMVDADASARIAKVRDSEVVILAPSLWRHLDGADSRLVVLSEENAKQARDIREMRGDYQHPF
ncbi:hypothetical protein [Actinokineospora terrae]|uniref:Uncharacterized protein n=1 Tax=Actinokineospora terrae TaxID=155974 RepID=A0A1H9RWZ1_9PSEU|nr:hypothetical protein [Actinokineospora terrae]SER77302.1 hypothetical protein SAMN04487818_105148 [Actinokineospora terrae]